MSLRDTHPLSLAALAVLSALAAAASAAAEPIHTIDAPRIVVADVVSVVEGGDVELGPAPPAGGSRLVERREVEARLHEAGIDGKVTMPNVVRVARASSRREPAALAAEAEKILAAALPPGVRIVSVKASRGVVVPPRAVLGKPEVKVPHRAGEMKTTLVFPLVADDEVVARTPITVTLDVSDEAAKPLVTRGSRIDVVISKGAARISAQGYALADADMGDVVQVKIDSTQKVLDARVASRESAVVVRP
ncbi:MAG TPA: flagella basal body P-ring formation protein FlgA [Polyangiaceae bacterium]|nr:flagella basal body P-ring formation protein FlgA [Polyangiaceae bacterium]